MGYKVVVTDSVPLVGRSPETAEIIGKVVVMVACDLWVGLSSSAPRTLNGSILVGESGCVNYRAGLCNTLGEKKRRVEIGVECTPNLC